MSECSCRGSNPNCFKCGGWGQLGDEIAQQRVNPDHSPLSPGTSKSQKKVSRQKMEKCEYCKKVFPSNMLNRHLKKRHRKRTKTVSINSESIEKNLPEDNFDKALKKKERSDIRKNEITVVVQGPFETRFGDKFLGYFARDKGKYGSISLYDDYGDESNSD
jgi:hypothetical protein